MKKPIKLSELIKKAKTAYKKYGDLPCYMDVEYGDEILEGMKVGREVKSKALKKFARPKRIVLW